MTQVEKGATPCAKSPLAAGVQRALPIVLGYVPVAFAFGVLAVKNNIPPGLAVLMSVSLFAGSGQFVAASLWGAGMGAASVVLMVFVVNLRHLLMSASLAPYLKSMSRRGRFWFGCELTDETFAVHITALQQGWKLALPTLYACNLTAHLSWIGGTVVGVLFGSLLTDVRPLGLDYALIAMFLALLVPQCRQRLHVLVALLSLVLSVSLRLAGIGQWNVIVATVAAAMIGAWLAGRQQGEPSGLSKAPKSEPEMATHCEMATLHEKATPCEKATLHEKATSCEKAALQEKATPCEKRAL